MKKQLVRLLGMIAVAVLPLCGLSNKAYGQAFGVELLGNLMPAAGGMGGTGIARPQDLQSAMALNPATLAQRKGTQFSFSGSWVEPTINLDNNSTLPLAGITPYDAKSQRPGSIVGNIGVTQDYSILGLPITTGVGLLTASGLGVNYRHVDASNGTSAELVVLGTGVGAGVQLTDRLAVGFLGIVATASMDGIFTGISSSTPDYNLRGELGLTYDLREETTLGAYWHTKQKHTFDDFVRLTPILGFQDLNIAFPNVYGIGVADESLMCGRLLLSVDFTYMEWSDADFFRAIWKDQFAVQLGAQYTNSRGIRFRMGYVYIEDASRGVVADSIGGIDPQGSVDYIQALFPNINKNRITGGIGLTDILPGVDMDLFAGGMFNESRDYGGTSAAAAGYWVGFGATWRFGRGGCNGLCIPNQW